MTLCGGVGVPPRNRTLRVPAFLSRRLISGLVTANLGSRYHASIPALSLAISSFASLRLSRGTSRDGRCSCTVTVAFTSTLPQLATALELVIAAENFHLRRALTTVLSHSSSPLLRRTRMSARRPSAPTR